MEGSLPSVGVARRPHRQRSAARGTLFVILVLGLATGLVSSTGATFNATNQDDGNIAAPALSGPGGALTATPSDNNVSLSWSGTSVGSYGNGYSAYVASANGTSCTGATGFSLLGSTNSTGTSLTDSTTNAGGANTGSWYCYQLRNAYWPSSPGTGTPTWTSQVSPDQQALQVGFVADQAHMPILRSVSSLTAPSGTINTTTNSTFTFTMASNTYAPAYSGALCFVNTNTIYISDTSGSGCGTTYQFGKLTGGTITFAGGATSPVRMTASYTWSGSNTLLTAKVTATNTGGTVSISGTWTYTAPPAGTQQPIGVNSQFEFHFNQPTNQQTPSGKVCFSTTGPTIYFGDSGAGNCNQSAANPLGTMAIVAGATCSCANKDRLTVTYSWVNNQTLDLTVTTVNNPIDAAYGTWTYQPSTTTGIKTSDTTVNLCTTANCQPQTS